MANLLKNTKIAHGSTEINLLLGSLHYFC